MVDQLPPMGAAPIPPLGGQPPLQPPMAPAAPPPPLPMPRDARKMARLRPYGLPEPEKKSKRPQAKWILDQKEKRVAYWKSRNTEMEADLALYLMKDAYDFKTTGDGGEEVIRRVTPRAMVDKLANMVDRQKDKIRTTPRAQSTEYIDAAQDVEDFLYDHRRRIDAKHAAKLNQSFAHDQAWYAAAMGWIASREYLEPGKPYPLCSELFDPRCCYPGPGAVDEAGLLSDMLYYEKTDKATFLFNNPRFASDSKLERVKDEDDVEITWYEDCYWSVILLDDRVLSASEHGYGFCPWLMVPCGGTPLLDKDARAHHGSGVLRSLRHIIEYDNRLHSQLASVIARQANPPVIMTYDSSKGGIPKEVDMRPGGRTLLDSFKGETATPVGSTERPDMIANMIDMARQDIGRGGVPDILMNDNSSINSGFQFTVMRFNAEDVLQPITKAIISHREWQHRHALNLLLVAERDGLIEPDVVADDETEPEMGVVYRRPNRDDATSNYRQQRQEYVYSVLTPEAIHRHGIENDVHLSNMTPQDVMQAVQAGVQGIQTKAFSRRYFWEHMLNIDNPDQMDQELIYETGMIENPEMMQEYAFPMVLQHRNPEAFAWFEQRRMQKMEEEAAMREAQAQQAAMAQPPPGPPGAAPLPSPGLDSTVLPPDMQSVTGIPGAGDAAAIDAFIASLTSQNPEGGL